MLFRFILLAALSQISFSLYGVETTKVELLPLATKVVLNARVEAITEATVSAQVHAKVKRVYVDVDDHVTTGTLLLELDDTELKAQLAKARAAAVVAQAQASKANSEFVRLQGLAQEQFVSDNEMTKATSAADIAKANIRLAQAQIAQVQQQLTYTKIIAPYSGVVTARHVEPGETANIGQALLSGFVTQQNRLYIHVPMSLISAVEAKQRLLAKNSNDTWSVLDKLTIAPNADKQTHTVMVRANIDKFEFAHRPGSFVQVAIETTPRQALLVPQSALFQQGDLSAVFVQLGSSYALRQVVVGASQGDKIELVSGVKQGDVVVTQAAAFAADRTLIKHK